MILLKRVLIVFLLVLLLAGCDGGAEAPAPVQPVAFYYRTAVTSFTDEDGVVRAEVRDLGAETYTDLELLELYLQGPRSEELVSPFSASTELTASRRRGGTLEIYLTRRANPPAELEHSLAYACLAKTALGLDGILKVRIRVSGTDGSELADVLLTENDIRLFDSGEAPESLGVTLYYADDSGTLLLTEKRDVPLLSPEELPRYVLELLLEPPQSAGMRSPLPPGTAVLDTDLTEGTFSVDFTADFYNNRPRGEQGEQLAVLSVVNTLCALEAVDQVQLRAGGLELSPYVWLELSGPLLLDTGPVGPVRQGLGEFTATLCLPGVQDGLLHRLTIRARAQGAASREETLVQALLSRTAMNGLNVPFVGAARPLSTATYRGVCTVNLAPGVLPRSPEARELALRALTATLCSLPEVEAVTVMEDGILVGDEQKAPSAAWFAVP